MPVITPYEVNALAKKQFAEMEIKLKDYIDYINDCIVAGRLKGEKQIQIDRDDFLNRKISSDLDVVTLFTSLEMLYQRHWKTKYDMTNRGEHILFIDLI